MRPTPPRLFACLVLLATLATPGCGARPASTQPREGEPPPPPEMGSRTREQMPGPVFRLKGTAPAEQAASEDAAAADSEREDRESGRE